MMSLSVILFIAVAILEITSQPILIYIVSPTADGQDVNTERHPFGRATNLLKFTEDNKIFVDYAAIEEIFLHPDIADRKVVVVSIIGAYRKGKSFLMDYFLRYMYGNYKSINNPNNNMENAATWIGAPDEPLTGFSWKSGSERHTNGIVIWSDVFLYEDSNKTRYAVVLMDTQGLLETKTPSMENSKIFAIATLLSSMQIFNLNDLIQEDQLQYLQMVTDYASLAKQDYSRNGLKGRTFQNLLFLMRDRANVDEFEYGLNGGRRYLLNELRVGEDQAEVLQEVRRQIETSFEKVFCFLMPHPGSKMLGNKLYDGRWSEFSLVFKEQLIDLTTWLLKPENLRAKKIFNEELTSRQLSEYMQSIFKMFDSPGAPVIQSIYEATIDRQMRILIDNCMQEYTATLYHNLDYSTPNFLENLENIHESAEAASVLQFQTKKKMGDENHKAKYLNMLSERTTTFWSEWKEIFVKGYHSYIRNKIALEELLGSRAQDIQAEIDEELRKIAEEAEQKRSGKK